MIFTVIDRRTKEPADARSVITEFCLPKLTESYGDFGVDTDGVLLVMDYSGHYVYLDPILFTVEWTEES